MRNARFSLQTREPSAVDNQVSPRAITRPPLGMAHTEAAFGRLLFLPLALEAAHQRGALATGLHEEREVGAGEHELHAHRDVALEELGRVHAAHAGEFA